MTMEDMRRSIKKHRKAVIIVVVVLTVGLVSSFAFLGTNNTDFSALKGNGNDLQNVQAQIDALEQSIAEATKEQGSEMTFSENKNMADLYASLAEAYMKIGDAKMSGIALKAATFFQASLDTAPVELNNQGKANIHAQKALMLFLGGQNEKARAEFTTAISLVPHDLNINQQYTYVLYNLDGLDAALSHINKYKDSLAANDTNRQVVDQIISDLKSFDQQKKSAQAVGEATSENSTE
ncbi:MAG: tetratricopeptide repeat protein [Bacillota bacterium]